MLLFGFIRLDLLQVPEGAVLAAQGVDLMLGEVADAGVFVGVYAPCKRRQDAGKSFHQGTFPCTVAPKDADARVGGDAQADAAEDGVVAVAEGESVCVQHRVGVVFGTLELQAVVGFRRRGRGGVEFFEGFEAALCLARFGRLGAEAVDVGLQVGTAARLFLVFGVGLQTLFVAQSFEVAVIAGVGGEALVFDVEDASAEGVKEFAVVGDDDLGDGQGFEVVLQPDDGVEVKVVGGFVE